MKDLDLSCFWGSDWDSDPVPGLCAYVNMSGAIHGWDKPHSQPPGLPNELCCPLHTTGLILYGKMQAQIWDVQNPSEILFLNVMDFIK